MRRESYYHPMNIVPTDKYYALCYSAASEPDPESDKWNHPSEHLALFQLDGIGVGRLLDLKTEEENGEDVVGYLLGSDTEIINNDDGFIRLIQVNSSEETIRHIAKYNCSSLGEGSSESLPIYTYKQPNLKPVLLYEGKK